MFQKQLNVSKILNYKGNVLVEVPDVKNQIKKQILTYLPLNITTIFICIH